MESVLRMRTGFGNTKDPLHDTYDDDEDVAVDFSNAVLYVGALQTIAATVFTSAVTILACVAFPTSFVSAIRTLVMSSTVGILVVRKPFRLGKVHGLTLIFRALQPCVLIYIGSQIAEQLVHTCTRDVPTPSWRRFVFHAMSALMLISGFMRARRPLAQTDLPFLITILAIFVVSMLPPPAVILSGPLCSPPTLSLAAERVVRAFVFSLLYSVFVYAAAPPVQSSSEVLICVMRASAASVWVLAGHSLMLPFAVIQGSVVIYTRIFGEEYSIDEEVTPLMTPTPGREDDINSVGLNPELHADPESVVAEKAATMETSSVIVPQFHALGARALVDIGHTGGFASVAPNGGNAQRVSTFSESEMARVAARLEAEANDNPSTCAV
jgi:hypothetical protein